MQKQQPEVECPITIFTTSVVTKKIEKQDKRQYQRITEFQRVALLQKILQEKKKIIKAAIEVGVNYSTAKAVLKMYRKNQHQSSLNPVKSNAYCNYLNFPAYFLTNLSQISVISSVGGQVIEKETNNEKFQVNQIEQFMVKDKGLSEPLFLRLLNYYYQSNERKINTNFYSLFNQFLLPDLFPINS